MEGKILNYIDELTEKASKMTNSSRAHSKTLQVGYTQACREIREYIQKQYQAQKEYQKQYQKEKNISEVITDI
jgi:predicted secreted Zn-dependent protease